MSFDVPGIPFKPLWQQLTRQPSATNAIRSDPPNLTLSSDMLDLPVPNSVLGQELHPLLDHLHPEPGRRDKDRTLLRLDLFARLNAG
jgi:hypothetical protein